MLSELNFVKGAVSTKDLIPVLTHFCFYQGRVQGGNGRLYMDAPGGIEEEITLPAGLLIKAINACTQNDVQMKVTKKGNFIISSGSFRASIPISPDSYPVVKPEGKEYPGTQIIPALRQLQGFIGTDASRAWACGVLFQDGYCYATNNVSMVRVPVQWAAPDINLPGATVNEILRTELPIDSVMVADNSVTFHSGDRWIRSQLFDLAWPEVASFFQGRGFPGAPPGLLEAIEKVLPFCPDSKAPIIVLGEEGVSTADGEMSASVSGMSLPPGRYRAETLLLALSSCDQIDLGKYPAPIPFSAPGGLEGVLVGVRG